MSGEIEFLDLEPAPDASATGGRTASGATAAAWTLVEQVRALRSGRTVRGRVASHLGLAATALCAGTAATVYLDVRATADSLALERDPGYHGPALTYGPFLWFCLAAIACGLAGTLASLVAARRSDVTRT
ncbi:MAG TPA: hypothetical protein VFT67_13300 [Jatrophihabitantaceae bacterium]|nr:hypothetical protein [Jatrophihabitantaceae bacterium]